MHKTEPRIKGIIKECTQSLKNLGINAERVILYGSFAKGYTPEEIKAASQASFLREILEAGVSV